MAEYQIFMTITRIIAHLPEIVRFQIHLCTMKHFGLSSVLRWDIGSIAHNISSLVEKEDVEPYHAPMIYYSLQKWKEFKKILCSKKSYSNQSAAQIKSAFIARGHNISDEMGNKFIVNVNGRRFLVEKKFDKRYFTITNEMFLNGKAPLASKSEIMSNVSVPRYVEFIEMYTKMLDSLPDVLRTATTLNNKNTKIAAITLPYVRAKLEDSGVLADIVAQTVLCGDYVALNFQISDLDKRQLILTEDNIDDVIRLLPTALNDVENFDFYFSSERFSIVTL